MEVARSEWWLGGGAKSSEMKWKIIWWCWAVTETIKCLIEHFRTVELC